MQLLYIASVRVPSEKASGLAIMRQCKAFSAETCDVVLLAPDFNDNIELDAFAYYDISPTFTIKKIWAIDFLRTSKFGFYLSRFSMMIRVFIYCVRHIKQIDVIYTRDQWMLLLPSLFLKHKILACEIHTKHKDPISVFVLKGISKLISISKGLEKYYRLKLGRSDILVEPSGVNLDQFKNLPPLGDLRINLSIPTDKIIVGYIGKYSTMGEEKGVTELVKAFSRSFKNNPNLYLMIVGLEAHEINLVTELCEAIGLPSYTYSLLPLVQKDFAFYLEVSDILIMNYPDTDHYRKFMSPTKLFAYMASGKVIVSSDLPSVREIVDESMVIFVKPGDVINLQEKLELAVTEFLSSVSRGIAAKNAVVKYCWRDRALRIFKYLNFSE